MARKYYPVGIGKGGVFAHPERQNATVRDYVGKHWEDAKSGIGMKTYGGTARSAIAPDPTHHRMTAAKNRLKRGWTSSRKKALSPKNIRKAAKKGGVKGARQSILRTHAVKFGADPYHK